MSVASEYLNRAASAVLTVGDARGFLIGCTHPLFHPLVVTASHCLPTLPPPHPFSYDFECSYPALLGALGETPSVMAECVFVDPIADLAVLGSPDNQSFPDDADAYEAFVSNLPALPVGVLTAPSDAWLLTLDGRWESCTVRQGVPQALGRRLTLVGARDGNAAGTSGSPIMAADGRVVGVVSVGNESNGRIEHEQPGQPALAAALPLWLLANLRVSTRLARTVSRAWIDEVKRVTERLKA